MSVREAASEGEEQTTARSFGVSRRGRYIAATRLSASFAAIPFHDSRLLTGDSVIERLPIVRVPTPRRCAGAVPECLGYLRRVDEVHHGESVGHPVDSALSFAHLVLPALD